MNAVDAIHLFFGDALQGHVVMIVSCVVYQVVEVLSSQFGECRFYSRPKCREFADFACVELQCKGLHAKRSGGSDNGIRVLAMAVEGKYHVHTATCETFHGAAANATTPSGNDDSLFLLIL